MIVQALSLASIPLLESWMWIGIALIILVLIVVGIIAVIIFISKKILSSNKKEMNILKERLAKGEITKEEYDKIKKELK